MNRVNTSYAETRDLGSSTSQLHDAPVVRFVNQLLLDAVKKGASDIHLEPYEHQFRIRFRVDGLLRETESPARGRQRASQVGLSQSPREANPFARAA